MSFFHKPHHDFHWLAGMLSGAGLLVMAAVFISSGGLRHASNMLAYFGLSPSSQTACIINCEIQEPVYIISWDATPSTISSGQVSDIFWRVKVFTDGGYGSSNCWIGGGPFGPDATGYIGPPTRYYEDHSVRLEPTLQDDTSPPLDSSRLINLHGPNGTIYSGHVGGLNPSSTTRYSIFCSGQPSTGGWTTIGSVTLTVNSGPPPTPVLSITATPPSIPYGGFSTIDWSAQNVDSCVMHNDWNQLSDQKSGSQYRGPFYNPSETFTLVCQSPAGQKTKSATVTTYATSCANGLNFATYGPSCSCPSGQIQSGSSCVVPTCPNGLTYGTYGPSCTCPSGQVQSGSSCVAPTCANGLNYATYGPSCSCASGQVVSGSSCVAPGQPTAAISANPPSAKVGQPISVHATFAAGANDSLTGTNIDSPVGTGLAANTNPGTKDITYTPSSPGTYTFYARVATTQYPWQTKDTVSVVVSALPVPQALGAACNTAGTSVATSWSPVAGADNYWVGLDNTTNNTVACSNGWMCTTPPDYSLTTTATSRTFSTIPNQANRLLVSSCVGGSCSGAAELDFTCAMPPSSMTLTANGQTGLATVPVNTPVTISWSSQNVEPGSCRVSNNANATVWSGDNSSQTIAPITSSRIYRINCNTLAGTPAAPTTVTLNLVPGSIDQPLTAVPARVQMGHYTHLSWHTVGMVAGSCSLTSVPDHGVISTAPASSDTAAIITSATTFTLRCSDGTNQFTQSVGVTEIPVVIEQ